MRKVVGIGESILDIIFKDHTPVSANPGGSTFNCMISLARCGVLSRFISEVGNDPPGRLIRDFMRVNRLSDHFVAAIPHGGNTPVALAFLDGQQQADYTFYKNLPPERLLVTFPTVEENDVVIFGSYYALNPLLRDKVREFLLYARHQKAILYYDINFRKAHAYEVPILKPSFLENLEYATIVRCSDEDLSNLYPGKNMDQIIKDHIRPYSHLFIVTQGAGNVLLYHGDYTKAYDVSHVIPLSTVGAGDNFNAGIIYGILKYGLTFNNITRTSGEIWNQIISFGISFASEVCCSYDNYISTSFAEKFQYQEE